MFIVLTIASFFMVLLVFGSLIHHSYWLFKALEFPRLQKLFLIILILCGWIVFWRITNEISWIAVAALAICLLYLLYKILPYTPVFAKEVKNSASRKQSELKVFTANVFQENTNYTKLLKQISQCDPDIILLLETDEKWIQAISQLKNTYPYVLEHPMQNTYGLAFYSRLKIIQGRITFLSSEEVPSVDAVLMLPSGQHIQVWGLHPKPPVPQESITTHQQDKELMKIAFKAKEKELPVVVIGDLNDVAWSYTTILFKKVSGLLDPRRGRGFYNTFSTRNWFMRFPLDYLFCSKHFGLVSMKRLSYNGSDHFPIFIHLTLSSPSGNEQHQHSDKEDIKEAKEMAQQ